MDKQQLEYARSKIRNTEGTVMRKLFAYAAHYYGQELLDEAWEEFWLWPDELPSTQDKIFECTFIVWAMFDWFPEDSPMSATVPLATHYLTAKADSLTPYQRGYIAAVCDAPFSFFLVKDAVPGLSLTLHDIFTKQDVLVQELEASRLLRKGQVIYTKVISFNGIHVMFGCSPRVFSTEIFARLIETREHIEKEIGWESLDAEDKDYITREHFVDFCALQDIPITQRLANTDGERFVLCEAFFDLFGSVQDAFEKLKEMAGPLADDMPEEAEYGDDSTLSFVKSVWATEGNKMNVGWDNTILGRIEIRFGEIKVSVNSVERAQRARRIIETRLGKSVCFREVKETDLSESEQAAAESSSDSVNDLTNLPEAQEVMKKMIEMHWNAWPDTHLPALEGMTPREAAQSPRMREKLQMLFLSMEGRDPARLQFSWMAPDINALKRDIQFEE